MSVEAKSLKIEKMNKWFGSNHIVKDFSIDVEPGEFLVLLGPSGCGKTTALRTVAGLEEANSGKILIGETDVTHMLPKLRNISMVFQSYALYPHKTVAENIGFPLKVRKITGAEKDNAIMEAAKQVQMEPYLERYPKQLSGGQRQRVALARAIIRRPDVFLMDEPLSNLDAKLRVSMRAELKRMQHELGVTTVYVTHDQVEAMTLASRVVIMSEGVLQQVGTPKEVYENPSNAFVGGFMGSPSMNFVEGSLGDGIFQRSDQKIKLETNLANPSVLMGFRPEDAEIVDHDSSYLSGKVFTSELVGDYTLVTIDIDNLHLTIKMPSDFEADYDKVVSIKINPQKIYFFDSKSQERI
jgi:multiple sugar transport system ATP-binding protein